MAGGIEVADLFATLGLHANEGEWGKGNKLIEGVKRGIEVIAGYEAVKKLGEMVEQTVAAAVGAERLAQKVGITAQSVQELGYAADVSGASTEDLQTSLQHLARGMEEMRTKGTGPAADAFKSLGVRAAELKGKKPDEVLEALADHFAKLPDGAQKTAAAMDLFGRSGTSLIPLLNKGSAGIEELRGEAEKLGVVIDENGIKKSEEYEESQKRLSASWQGLKNKIVEVVLPAFQALIDGLSQVVAFFSEHHDALIAVLVAIGAAMLVVATNAAIAWAAVLGPLLPIIAAVAAVAGAIALLIDNWSAVKSVVGGALTWIWIHLRSIGKRIAQFFLEDIPNAIKHAIKWLGEKIVDAFRAAFEFISNLPVVKQILAAMAWAKGLVDSASTKNETALEAAARSTTDLTPEQYRNRKPFQAPADLMGKFDWDAIGAYYKHDATVPQTYVPPRGQSGGAPNITINAPATFQINASGTDPQGVVDIAKKQIQEHHDRTWSDAHASTGGRDTP